MAKNDQSKPPTLYERADALRAELEALSLAARAAGEHELFAVAKRAVKEFQHPSYTGQANKL